MKTKQTFTPPLKILVLAVSMALTLTACGDSNSDSANTENTASYCAELPSFSSEKKFWSYADTNVPIVTLSDIATENYNSSYVLIDSVILGSFCEKSTYSDGYTRIECRPAFASGSGAYAEKYFYLAPSLCPRFLYGTDCAMEMRKNDLIRWCLFLNENGTFSESSVVGVKKIGTESDPVIAETEASTETDPGLSVAQPETENHVQESDSADSRLQNATIFTADVSSGIGNNIVGQRAYIIFPKSELQQITESGYALFLSERVKDSGYNWFSIICDDGTGIVFNNSFTGLGTYGKMDSDGSVYEVIGYITATESGYVYEAANE